MDSMSNEKMQFAVLIDADNISSKYAVTIFEELEKYGSTSYRRIYGNWSKGNGWSEGMLLEYSIMPVQQFSYTTGKNATDMAMVIDAMDILYKNKVQGFCLVTSDSDFTRLAMRLREENMFVLGMGESKTPLALTRACNRFIHLNLVAEQNMDEDIAVGARNSQDTRNNPDEKHGRAGEYTGNQDAVSTEEQNVTSIADVRQVILTLINESGGRQVDLARVGNRLNDKFTDFDVRNYGYSLLSRFLEEIPSLKLVKNNTCINVELKENQESEDEITSYIKTIVKLTGKKGMRVNELSNSVHRKYAGFTPKNYGYSQFTKFLQAIPELELYGDINARKVRFGEEE